MRILLLLLCALGASACAAPPAGTRNDTLVRQRSGDLSLRVDTRAYVDRPLEVELPPGPYSTLTLYELEGSEREQVLLVGSGDARLEGAPLRVQILFPSAEGKAPAPGEYLLVVTDGAGKIHELRFAIVSRSASQEPDA